MKIIALKKMFLISMVCAYVPVAGASKWSEALAQAGNILQQVNEVAQYANKVKSGAIAPNGMDEIGALSSVKVATDANALNKGYFIDPLTNLTWSRCPVPMTWNGSGCVGETVYAIFNYRQVLATVNEMNAKNYAGYSDWRLPTLNEVLLTTYGTTKQGTVLNKRNVRGLDIWKNKLIRVGQIINGECTIGCTWGNPWTSSNMVTGAGQEFAYLNLSRADLYGEIYDPNETVTVGDGIEYATYDSGRSAQEAVVRLVRGGNGPQDNGLSAVKQYQTEQSARSAAFNQAYDQAQAETKQCQKEKNAVWRKNIKVGDVSDKGGVIAVNGPIITVNLKDGSFKNFTPSQLENALENTFCMSKQFEVIKQFE
ncbi:hypothetical protein BS636_10725 [Acinetobacter sp. LoGeW2-3]|uniref:Lcl C-terminal domain-containing protein n=1 Tax=Acinetobacter sp. LoGeW2-3 TaxID=1808001 RepID=UPI000C05C157|nr:DUF1566 domain-containing protein [Acinetobacter sp. LoGeW2-3]ATO20098.1 hypothetical protein BS636_10725 [Acinetobacter sp. LoGeW2-3]